MNTFWNIAEWHFSSRKVGPKKTTGAVFQKKGMTQSKGQCHTRHGSPKVSK